MDKACQVLEIVKRRPIKNRKNVGSCQDYKVTKKIQNITKSLSYE